MKTFYFDWEVRGIFSPSLRGLIRADDLESAKKLLWEWVQERAGEDNTGHTEVMLLLNTKPASVKLWVRLPEEVIFDNDNWSTECTARSERKRGGRQMTDKEQQERDAFEKVLTENPNDLVTRRVFADWLDEHDDPEAADFQRRWPQSELENLRGQLEEAEELVDYLRQDERCAC